MERTWLKSMVSYWLEEYDCRKHEAQMNEYPHYRVAIDDIPPQSLYMPGVGPAPTPLVITPRVN